MLRERFAHRYHNRSLFGLYSRNHRGESSRRGESSGSSLARVVGGIGSRRPFGTKLVEAHGSPLVDTEALKSLIRLFRVVQVFLRLHILMILKLDVKQQVRILNNKQTDANLSINAILIGSHFIKVNCRGFS